MSTYVAFLRGINVGGHRRIKMAELRQAFESSGFQKVKTLLATGNVVFESPKTDAQSLTQSIEEKLKATFGYEIDVILRTIEQIQELVDSNPFKAIEVTPDTRLYVTFLSDKPNSRLKIPYESPEKDYKILDVAGGAVYSVLTLAANTRSTDAMAILGKEFGKKITTRNWNTITKIVKS